MPSPKIKPAALCHAALPCVILFLLITCLLSVSNARAGGTWSPLAHLPPAGLNNCLLLSDGTVICGDGGQNWYRLAPDIHGSYVNGTWTLIARTHYTRLFYSSQVLTNGNVYVAGGEYGTGTAHAELYNTLNNTWADIPQPGANPSYSDAVSKMLPNGNVLQGTTGGGVWIYNTVFNTITAATSARNQNEACWVRLPNDNILTVDAFGTQSEHYVPSLNAWYNDDAVPVSLYGFGGEMGAGFVLPNGNVFYIGGTTHTAIYTPGSTLTAPGSWVAGPEMVFGTNNLGAVDAPAAMMANGKILCALGQTNGFNGPTYFYEYDYLANSFTQVNGPTGATLGSAPFVMSMLDLPDGTILFVSGQGSRNLYVYFPDGSPVPAGQPVINSITMNADGSYHASGTGFNGLSGGAAYGDDWQMDSNYPLIRMTNNATRNIYYARTYRWSSSGVMTSNKIITTEFSLPSNLPAGTYSLVLSANGNPSDPQTFTYSPIAAPTGLSAVPGNRQLTLSWNPVSGATAYNIKRSSVSGAYYVQLASITGTNYTNTGLTNGSTYYYVVTAVGSGGPSANSAEIAASPFGPPPAPTGLLAGPDSYVGVSLSWNSTPGATSYNVKSATTSGGPYTTIANRASTDYNDTNILSGTTYYYVVSGVNAAGESGNSTQAAATPSNSGDVLAGLAANWHFDDNGGTIALDSSPNNNTGTLVNGPTWTTPGRIGVSDLAFVATNSLQAVTANSSASLNMTAGITIAAWINATDWNGNRRILQKGNSDNQYRLLAENNLLRFHLNGVNTVTCPLPPTNVWMHVACTWNGSTMTIYINGVPQASQSSGGSITTTADPLTIGSKNGSTVAGDFFYGQIDELRLYNRGLTLSEINTVMHSGDTPPGTPTGIIAGPWKGEVRLSWNTDSGAASYNVKRSTTTGGPYTTIGSAFATTYTDAGLTNGTTYYYVVSAVNFTNESADSIQVSAIPAIGVAFYGNVNYGGAATRVLGPGSYDLSQLVAAGMPNDAASSGKIAPGWTATIYQNSGFAGTVWTLTSDIPNFSAYSGLNNNMSSCRITAGVLPGVPSGLAATPGYTQVSLSWNTSANAASYNLKRSSTSGGPYTTIAGSTGTSFVDTGLANGTTYYYVVSARNITGESANSAEVSATPFITPVTLTPGPATNGQFSFSYPGDQSWVIETSTDLFNWTPIFTNPAAPGAFTFTDTNAVDPARFYRARQ